MKSLMLCAAAAFSLAAGLPALAQNDIEYPAPTPYPFPQSRPTGRLIVIPPYRHVFVQRVYTTPPQQPLYNVPPYSIIAPY